MTRPLLTEADAAALLGVKPQTLSVWRMRGYGPKFRKIGRLVRYDATDLEEYSAGRKAGNTAQAAELTK